MEKIIVLIAIFVSIGFLIRHFVQGFKNKGSCHGCKEYCGYVKE